MKKAVIAISIAIAVLLLAVGGAFAYREQQYRSYPREYAEYVSKASEEFDVPEPLVFAVIKTESGFDPSAVSSAGAVGLMQLMPDTYSWIAKKLPDKPDADKITDPETNLRVGVYYLSFLYDRFGSWEVALAGYNAGHGRVSGWLKDARYSNDGATLSDIPIEETKDYVNRVLNSRDKYEKLYYGDKNNESN